MEIAEEDIARYEPLISSFQRSFSPEPQASKTQSQLRYTSDYIRKMTPPTETSTPLEIALYNIYKGNYIPPKNFADISNTQCRDVIKIMSDIRIKTIRAQINKFKKKCLWKSIHPPQLYNLCPHIVDKYRELKQTAYYNAKQVHKKPQNPVITKKLHPHNLTATLK